MHMTARDVETYIPRSALKADASERVLTLSMRRVRQVPKDIDIGAPSETIRPVSRAALQATASSIVTRLATPKKNHGEVSEFSRHFRVSAAGVRGFIYAEVVSNVLQRCPPDPPNGFWSFLLLVQ